MIYWGVTETFVEEISQMLPFLSKEELHRADKFKFEKDFNTYVISHFLMRLHLAKKLSVPTELLAINFVDKPTLKTHQLDFNLSHSHNFFAFCIAPNNRIKVGVDIEKVRVFDFMGIVENYYHKHEIEYVDKHTLSKDEKLLRFFEIWTRKEAYLKMLGWGITKDLTAIDLCPDSNGASLVPKAWIESLHKGVFTISYAYSGKHIPTIRELTIDDIVF